MRREDAARAARAERRRLSMAGEVVAAGTDKPELYQELSPEERIGAMAALVRRQWLMSGRSLPERTPRSTWPGEVFELPWAR